jgi:diguanylate cyclase (GGDEF)-like protein
MGAEAVLGHVLGKARELLLAEVAEVVLFDRATGSPVLRQRSTDASPQGAVLALGTDVGQLNWSELVSSGHAVFVSCTGRGPTHVALRERLGVRDFIVAPLRAEEPIIGAILVANRLGNVSTFDAGDCRLFETLANHASIAFENSQLVNRLREEAEERRLEALHDALTGLPNRALFAQQVDEALGNGTATIMLMDLDRFKEINDTLGHHNGDLLLCKVAGRLVASLGKEGFACRFGGDEFAILLPDVSDKREAERVASQVLDALHQPFIVEELSLNVGASIGIAMAPEHGEDAATLLQRADVAMYQAKGSRSGAALYSSEQDTNSPRRLALSGELRQAIESGEILVYFQPQARVSDGEIVSAEALVRWRHPEHGLLGPDEFIPTAEQTGLIVPLTNHVLHVALRQCAEWRRAGYDIGVAVNLSIRSLLDINLPRDLNGLLRQYDVPANKLTLEITESSVMADPGRTIDVLERLAFWGIRLSVDDFGTGYSSLSYLQRLPVQEVKVDKSFVFRMSSDSGDCIIVQSIIELGHNLGLSVVAEGVEDQISWDRLRLMNCDLAQGYHLSRPVPATVVTHGLPREAPVWTRREWLGAVGPCLLPPGRSRSSKAGCLALT